MVSPIRIKIHSFLESKQVNLVDKTTKIAKVPNTHKAQRLLTLELVAVHISNWRFFLKQSSAQEKDPKADPVFFTFGLKDPVLRTVQVL